VENSNVILEVKDLTVAFGGRTVVDNISYTLRRGTTLGIVGESGSGKSVSSLALMGLLPKQATVTGSALLSQSEQKEPSEPLSFSPNGSDCNKPTGLPDSFKIFSNLPENKKLNLLELGEEQMRAVRGQRISMIFQEPMTSLNPVQKCGAQVMEMMRAHLNSELRTPNSELKNRVIELFREVLLPRPEKIFDSYPHEISGGQKQRVMIAMALVNEPDILIADEPTTALDVTVQKTILDLLRQLQRRHGTSILFITHDLGVISQIADDILVMYRGHVVEHGPAADILRHPRQPYTQGLLACRPPLEGKPRRLPTVEEYLNSAEVGVRRSECEGRKTEDGSRKTEDESRKSEVGSRKSEVGARRSECEVRSAELCDASANSDFRPPTSALISVKDLTVEYTLKRNLFGRPLQTLKGVDGVSFDIREGETLGLVGESGCGKTTLGRALLRLIDHSAGSVSYRGTPLDRLSHREMQALRPKLQIIFQDPYSSLNPRITIGDAISEPLQVHRVCSGECVVDSTRGQELPTTHYPLPTKERVCTLMQQVGLDPDWYSRYPHELSGGQRQRVCIARALILQPELVVCDESVSALDVSVQAQVLNLLNDLKERYRFTYLFITHDLSVVHYMADRILVMQKGKVVESGTPDDLFRRPQTDYTKTLIEAIPRIS
jgi:peptide/nickel transport system ATP-binding protein